MGKGNNDKLVLNGPERSWSGHLKSFSLSFEDGTRGCQTGVSTLNSMAWPDTLNFSSVLVDQIPSTILVIMFVRAHRFA